MAYHQLTQEERYLISAGSALRRSSRTERRRAEPDHVTPDHDEHEPPPAPSGG